MAKSKFDLDKDYSTYEKIQVEYKRGFFKKNEKKIFTGFEFENFKEGIKYNLYDKGLVNIKVA